MRIRAIHAAWAPSAVALHPCFLRLDGYPSSSSGPNHRLGLGKGRGSVARSPSQPLSDAGQHFSKQHRGRRPMPIRPEEQVRPRIAQPVGDPALQQVPGPVMGEMASLAPSPQVPLSASRRIVVEMRRGEEAGLERARLWPLESPPRTRARAGGLPRLECVRQGPMTAGVASGRPAWTMTRVATPAGCPTASSPRRAGSANPLRPGSLSAAAGRARWAMTGQPGWPSRDGVGGSPDAAHDNRGGMPAQSRG